ncbi:MAG: hypothetical protein IJI68_09075 [Eggerthellaceae bacterium]|nr:hypothetical protein [Eggerthellaceae bacterium]
MVSSLIERQVENAMEDLLDDKAVRVVKGINKVASKQGGDSILENYQLLGKRTVIALGVAIVAVQVAASIVGFVAARKSEEQRIERVVRRVLEEEQQKAEAEVEA